MALLVPFVALTAGVFFASAGASATLAVRRPGDRAVRWLAVGATALGLFAITLLFLVGTTDVASAEPLVRVCASCSFVGLAGFFGAAGHALHAGGSRTHRLLAHASLVFAAYSALSPGAAGLLSLEAMRSRILPWGEPAFLPDGPADPLVAPILDAGLFAAFLWSGLDAIRARSVPRAPWLGIALASFAYAAAGIGDALRHLGLVSPWPFVASIHPVAIPTLAALLVARERESTEALARAHGALREQELRYRAVLDSTFQFIGLLDLEGNLLLANRASLEPLGLREEDVLGRPFADAPWWSHDPEAAGRLREAIDRASKEGFDRFQTTHRTADGRLLEIDFSLSAYRDTHGTVRFLVPEGRDVTELVKLQSTLHDAEKMQALGQLSGGIAHDFNNMLAAMKGCVDLLRNGLPAETKLRSYVDILDQSIARAVGITGHLRRFARSEPARRESFEARREIEEAIHLVKWGLDSRVRLVERLDVPPTSLVGDASRLQSAVLNLGLNARDAMPDGGTLAIGTSLRHLHAEDCDRLGGSVRPGPHLVLSVSDTGTGMAPEIRDRIFEPFFTTKPVGRGTGLGLASVYTTAKDFGGSIEVESELGKGSTFRLYLPVVAPTTESQARRLDAAASPLVVLVADDEAPVRAVSRALLEELGCEVVDVEDGREAVRAYRERRRFDLVLLDQVMPHTTGDAAFREIRAFDPSAKVAIVSGYLRGADVTALLDQGLVACLAKPCGRRELATLLERIRSRDADSHG